MNNSYFVDWDDCSTQSLLLLRLYLRCCDAAFSDRSSPIVRVQAWRRAMARANWTEVSCSYWSWWTFSLCVGSHDSAELEKWFLVAKICLVNFDPLAVLWHKEYRIWVFSLWETTKSRNSEKQILGKNWRTIDTGSASCSDHDKKFQTFVRQKALIALSCSTINQIIGKGLWNRCQEEKL